MSYVIFFPSVACFYPSLPYHPPTPCNTRESQQESSELQLALNGMVFFKGKLCANLVHLNIMHPPIDSNVGFPHGKRVCERP